jgi:phage N-6-adenine-methyltransferase
MKNRNLEHSDNWATPRDIYDKLNEEFSFDFDPCPLNEGEITPDKDGLLIQWGQRNFINPPYSKKLKEAFVRRAVQEYKNGKLCVMLLPVSTSTSLFHDWIKPHATEIRFFRGRIPFEGVNTFGVKVGKGSAPMHDSMLCVFDGRKTYNELKEIFG